MRNADLPKPTVRRRQAALDYLYGRIDFERSQGADTALRSVKLDRMRQLLAKLNCPEDGLRIVHVAGTKGKGSVSTMIAAVLTAAGYRTGLFTSPHLEKIEERFAINGEPCSAAVFVSLVERIQPAVREMDREAEETGGGAHGPTYFEITTAMALLHFATAGTEAAVLEVGLGGRLDATNVCRPEVSVITNVSLDHTNLLGNTTAAIAREKAGIIKPDIPVVSGVDDEMARTVVRDVARQHSCQLLESGREFTVTQRPAPVTADDGDRIHHLLDFRCQRGDHSTQWSGVPLSLLGDHQVANAATALATLCVLREKGWAIDIDSIRRGLQDVRLPARLEILSRAPMVIVDSAHNVASAAALSDTIRRSFSSPRRILVLALSQDKDAEGIVNAALPAFDEIVATQFENNPRALPADELGSIVSTAIQQHGDSDNKRCHVVQHPQQAWRAAFAAAGDDDLICIAGSFFLAAQLRGLIRDTAAMAVVDSTSAAVDPSSPPY